ncbi:MAG TPA: HAD family hydrolase [Candidatus Dormibacteraeota bacterium]|nr:HAD family hydrolase [Candidatus Dormibacteraeota bacterium]
MKRYKALILDLDGTTIASRGGSLPSQPVEQAVKAALPLVKVAVATGRSWHLAESVIRQLGITEPCILEGGSRIILPATGQIIFSKTLPLAKRLEVVTACLPLGYRLFVTLNDETVYVKRAEDVDGPVGKIELEAVPRIEAPGVIEKLSAIKGVAIHIASSWSPGDFVAIHITSPEGTKEHALAELLKFMNVAPEDAIGVGDNPNDLPLFNSVGLKVAMGNSPDELKAVADYVAPDLEHDGVADVIQKFILARR